MFSSLLIIESQMYLLSLRAAPPVLWNVREGGPSEETSVQHRAREASRDLRRRPSLGGMRIMAPSPGGGHRYQPIWRSVIHELPNGTLHSLFGKS